MREGLIVSNALFGKCMDKKEQGVKIPCYWFKIERQAFFWPSKEMACEGRAIIVGDLLAKHVLSDYKILSQPKTNGMTLTQKKQKDWCKEYLKCKPIAQKELLKRIIEHQYELDCLNKEHDEFYYHFDLQQYQTSLSQVFFIDDEDIIPLPQNRPSTIPVTRCRAEMMYDPFENFTTPTTIFFGLNHFKNQSQFSLLAVGHASSYHVVGSGALLLQARFDKGRYSSFDASLSNYNLRSYQFLSMLHSWLDGLPSDIKAVALKHLDEKEREYEIAGSKYYSGNNDDKNIDKLNALSNNWFNQQWIDFKERKEKEIKEAKEKQAKEAKEKEAQGMKETECKDEEYFDEFVNEMEKTELLTLNEMKLGVMKKMEATKKSGDWPPARRQRMFAREQALIKGSINYQHICIHYETIATYLRDPTAKEQPTQPSLAEREATTNNSREKSPSEECPEDHDLDLACSNKTQGAARRALKKERRMKEQKTKKNEQGL